MDVRTLRPDEREALLQLVDGWEVGDGWRGCDFFRRAIEIDPTYRDENVWVALDGDRLVSCVQIFPRTLQLGSAGVACGGIGTVYTAPSHRRRGLAETLLDRAADAMRQRGMLVSLLFASRIAWYTRLGWRSVGNERCVLEAADPEVGTGSRADVRAFRSDRDLDAVRELHDRFGATRPGPVIRDTKLWRAGLRCAGNPDEEFLVAHREETLLAYLRVIVLNGVLTVNEWAHVPGAETELADLVVRSVGPRRPDALAERAGAPDARARTIAPGLRHHPALADALTTRGMRVRPFVDPGPMLRCLDPTALARTAGIAETPQDSLLERAFPEADTLFWPTDRF